MYKKPFSPEAMDLAASEAEKELESLDKKAVEVVALWWQKWYMDAGHKRLGRILIKTFKKKGQTESMEL